MASKNYCLEHTWPLFTEQKIMDLENLHMYHIFKFCPKNEKLRLIAWLRLDISQQNFLYTSTKIWNDLIHINSNVYCIV